VELYCRTAVVSFRASLTFSYSDRLIAGQFVGVEPKISLEDIGVWTIEVWSRIEG
jgi:hypothetical protein